MQGVITKLLYFLSVGPFNLQAENNGWKKPEISGRSSQILKESRSGNSSPLQIQGRGTEIHSEHPHFLSKREVTETTEKNDLKSGNDLLPIFAKGASLVGVLVIIIVGLFLPSENETIQFLFQFAFFDYVFSMILYYLRYYTEKEKDVDRLLEKISQNLEDFATNVVITAFLAKIYINIFPPKQQAPNTQYDANDSVLPPTAASPKLFEVYTFADQLSKRASRSSGAHFKPVLAVET